MAIPLSWERLSIFFSEFKSSSTWLGVNVTIPYKQKVISLLDSIDNQSQNIGAVNTIVKDKKQQLTGYNTDLDGFMDAIGHKKRCFAHKGILIYGSGGSSRMIQYAAVSMGFKYIWIVSRDPYKKKLSVNIHRECFLKVIGYDEVFSVFKPCFFNR